MNASIVRFNIIKFKNKYLGTSKCSFQMKKYTENRKFSEL